MPAEAAATKSVGFRRIAPGGASSEIRREVAGETPIAIEFNGMGYAVLMASPCDLQDLAYGFALSERLIDRAGDLLGVDEHLTGAGILVRASLRPEHAGRVFERVRHRVSESSCGLCGIESLEQALRPLPELAPREPVADEAVFAALRGIRDDQPLNRATGAVHAAALCDRNGAIILVREDVGRHNAMDKLVGAMLRQSLSWNAGFALLTSRCSYELVEKAVLADCPMLVTISAATDLAVRRAAEAGLPLRVLARDDAMLASIGT
jgi:FdhD protein